MNEQGRFITVEGVEGVGKSTSTRYIEQLLTDHNIPCVCTREPGGPALSERIRELLLDRQNITMESMTELLLMFASRVQHVEELIKPALALGNWVVCDRFTDSTYAYQGGGRGISMDKIAQLEMISLGKFRPDLTLVLDLPVSQGMARALRRGAQDRFEAEDLAFFDRVRDVFLARAATEVRYQLVDASGDVQAVQARLRSIIEREISRAAGGA